MQVTHLLTACFENYYCNFEIIDNNIKNVSLFIAMKKFFTLSFFLFCSIIVAQQKSFKIEWRVPKIYATESFSYKLPDFSPQENYVYDPIEGLRFVAEWQQSQLVNENSAQLINLEFETIPSSELHGLDANLISSKLDYELLNTSARNSKSVLLSVNPIVKENGKYKRLIAFTLKYSSLNNNAAALKKNNVGVVSSVLKKGDWYRFAVDKSGIFKLNKSFLSQIGINVNDIDPKKIRIFGTGGRMLPYLNSENELYDPNECAIQVIGEADGSFDGEDYILFYAQGPNGYDNESRSNLNIYTNQVYYYINVGETSGKRIGGVVEPTMAADTLIDKFQEYKFYEKDEVNLANIGRRWFGDEFDVETSKSYNFNFPNLDTNTKVIIRALVASTAGSTTNFDLDVNGESVANLVLSPITDKSVVQGAESTRVIDVNSDDVSVELSYNKNGNPSAKAYLDFISVEATRNLSFSGGQMPFVNKGIERLSGVVEYQLTNASNVKEIWDVTDIYNVSALKGNSSSTINFKANAGILKEYLAFDSSKYYEPISGVGGSVNNQDLKGSVFLDESGQFKDVDYIILTTQAHLLQAERLANINREKNGLNVKVYTVGVVYNEFSTGNRDIAALRNFIKYVYDNASAPEKRLKYVCLFGDGSVDYKGRSKFKDFQYEFPSWHSLNSFRLDGSYLSDDFYGMMDANEGLMKSSEKLDVAVGRIIANSSERAKIAVDKIERYYGKDAYGSWRNNVVVVSDDVDVNWETIIEKTTDKIGDEIEEKKPFINVTKIHSDAFKQESSSGGDRYPEVTIAFASAIEKGALLVNYFGHGGEDGLAKERIFDKSDIVDLRNEFKMGCLVTVTCEFTRFDNPFRETGGELMFWNKYGGAVNLVSTVRQIGVGVGTDINEELGKHLFSYVDDDDYEDYEYPSIAEAVRLTKIDPGVGNNTQRRFMFYFGDPAMKLAIPKPNVKLTKVNDLPIGQVKDTLKALSYVKLAGEVTDIEGNLLSNYNGVLTSTIFDKSVERETLANDNTVVSGSVFKMKYKASGAVIYRGKASVKNGKFEFDFIVPKDIKVPVGKGKISFYSVVDNFSEDQAGADVSNLEIGGVNKDAPEDNLGPEIQLFMNDESFVSGGITNESPTLLAKLSDDNGINTASGIGHDIVAIIDGDEVNPFVLNDYYATEVDNYKKGGLSYPFRNLEPGLHTLTLKAWDVYNNSSSAEIQFVVYDEDEELKIENVLNYPNPFINYTEFWFNHNSSEVLDISVQIFTVSGKLIRTLNGQTSGLGGSTTKSLSRDIIWDGRDDFGEKLGKGTYVYKLKVYSRTTNKSAEKIEKLVIL